MLTCLSAAGQAHLDLGSIFGLLSQFMPLWESEDDLWVAGCVMSHVSTFGIFNVDLHIEEVFAPKQHWDESIPSNDTVWRSGWCSVTNIKLLTGHSTVQDWAAANESDDNLQVQPSAVASRPKTVVSPIFAVIVIQKHARRYLLRKKLMKSGTLKARLTNSNAYKGATDLASKARRSVSTRAMAFTSRKEAEQRRWSRRLDKPIFPLILIEALSVLNVHIAMEYGDVSSEGSAASASAFELHYGDETRMEMRSMMMSAVNHMGHMKRFEMVDLHGKSWGSIVKKLVLALLKKILMSPIKKLSKKVSKEAAALAMQAAARRRRAVKAVKQAKAKASERMAAVTMQAAVRRRQAKAALRSRQIKSVDGTQTHAASDKSASPATKTPIKSPKSLSLFRRISGRRLSKTSSMQRAL